MPRSCPPPYTSPDRVDAALRRDGYALVPPEAVGRWVEGGLGSLAALAPSWERLVPDAYLRDAGRYRHRRHACFVTDGTRLERAPHRAHWQPLAYNALHGGLERWFEPVEPAVAQAPAWGALIQALASRCSAAKPQGAPWYVEAHQFRIDTAEGIGRPTPEGAHRDGVDFVAVLLVARRGIKGGETRVFEADGPRGLRFTLEDAWSLLLLDDERVIHETTPIQPTGPAPGHRDTLVLTYRSGGFQGPG